MLSFRRREIFSMQIDSFATKFFGSSALARIALPSPRETHFWYIIPDEVQNAYHLNQYMELLPPCEKDNVFQMSGDKLQKRALLARVLVRTTLARYINSHINPRVLKFKKNNFGKPEVDWQHHEWWDAPSLHFNISHTSSLIACGVTVDTPVGIDVEEKQRKIVTNILSFSRRYFSPYEVGFLHSISDPEIQRQEFVKLWTLKEAYVKALGKGFSGSPFKNFTIRIKAATTGNLKVPGDSNSEASEIFVEAFDDPTKQMNNWQFSLFELETSHYAAICKARANTVEGEEDSSMKLTVWKTLPLIEDECVSGTDAVAGISGLN